MSFRKMLRFHDVGVVWAPQAASKAAYVFHHLVGLSHHIGIGNKITARAHLRQFGRKNKRYCPNVWLDCTDLLVSGHFQKK